MRRPSEPTHRGRGAVTDSATYRWSTDSPPPHDRAVPVDDEPSGNVDDEPGNVDGEPSGNVDAEPGEYDAPGLVDRFLALSQRAQVALMALLVLTPLTVALGRVARGAYWPASDIAVLQLDLTQPGVPLTGVYSRFGFRHPGPALHWIVQPLWVIFGGRGFFVAAWLISAVAGVSLLVVVRRRFGPIVALATMAVLLTVVATQPEAFVVPWNPWVGLLPSVLAIALIGEARAGNRVAAPANVLLMSAVVQAHVGYAPLAAVVCVFTAVARVRSRRAESATQSRRVPAETRWSGWLARASIAGTVALWVGPVWQQFTTDEGNLSALWRFFRNPPEALAGSAVGRDAALDVLSWRPPWLESALSHAVGPPPWTALGAAVGFAAIAVVCWTRRRGLTPELRGAVPLLAVLAAATFIGASRIVGLPSDYLLRWTWTTAVVLAVATVASTHALLRSNTRLVGLANSALLGLVALCAIASVVGAGRTQRPDRVGSSLTEHVIHDVFDALDSDDVVEVYPVGELIDGAGAGIGAAIESRGVEVFFPEVLEASVGSARVRPGGRLTKRLMVETAEKLRDPATVPGVLVSYWDPLTPEDRAEINDLYFRILRAHDTGLAPDAIEPMRKRMNELQQRGLGIAVYLEDPDTPPI